MNLPFACLSALLRLNASPNNQKHAGSRSARLRTPARGLAAAVCALGAALPATTANAQANPVPYTFSTYAGGVATAYSGAGVACGGTGSGSKFTTLDAQGNGCPLTQAYIGPSISGVGVDGAGNVYFFDYSNGQVRKIDAKSGIVTKVLGTSNTLCSTTPGASGTEEDNLGDGCVFANARGPASARGMNVDPWGNVILASYNSNVVELACLATSPLCPNTAGRKQVGSFYRIAGCIGSQGGSATAASGNTAYAGGDNSPASPFQNLAGDVTAWGLTGAAATAATVGATGNACGSSTGGVNQARNAQADKYGNVYIADTNGDRYRVVLGPQTYNSVTNPLWAIIAMDPNYTAHEGYIYTILGSFSSITSGGTTYNVPTASGQACSSASGAALSTDAYGDGCAFFETGKPAGSTSPAGIGVDKDGNPIFSDNTDGLVRVLYVGGATMAHLISVNNGNITPTAGAVYALEGTGTVSKGTTPQLDVSNGSISSGNTKVAVDGQDNIYLSDGSGINIIDANTGYLRRPISNGGTLCAGGASNGDGCPQGQGISWTSLSSVGTAIAVDNLGNLYLADSTGRVRKVLAGSLYTTAVGGSFTQTLQFHEPAGTTSITATLQNAAPGISIGTPSCTVYSSTDTTADCTIVVTIAPTAAGRIGATLAVTNVGGGGATTLYPLAGTATGAALVTDAASPATSTFASLPGSNPASLAFDNSGNLYTIDNLTNTVKRVSGGTVTTVGTAPAGANQVAVDATGNVYVTAVGATSVTEYVLGSGGTYSPTTITNASVAKPQGIAIDSFGNLYLSDATTTSVYEVPNNAGFANLGATVAIATGFANPTLLAFDAAGNLLIADTGVVDRLNAQTGTVSAVASSSSGGVAISGLTPVGIAADAGNNVYIQDGASKSIYEVPYQTFAPGDVTVLTGETTPSGVAVDGSGNVYAVDAGLATPAIVKVARAAATYTFPNPVGTTVFNGTFTNAGNANTTGYAQTDIPEFPYSATGSGGCGTMNTTSVLPMGAACTFSVTPNLGNTGNLVSNTTTVTPAGSTGSLVLAAQEPSGVTYTTTTNISGPATAVYAASGAELTFTVTETSSNNNSQNGENINVVIDSGAAAPYVITGGQVSVPVSGLRVGAHTITATYPGDGTYLTSNKSANFSITQATPVITWTPATTTGQYSAALGTGVLNASANVPGYFVYTATNLSGPTTQFVHSASYLAIGSYTLAEQFFPTDSQDYSTPPVMSQPYTVAKASTTAAVGTSQFLVASDGTGNYTSVQAAVNALPSGGSVYIKPGTYTGNIAVVQPNIALRGLGGDPTKVVLTHEGGAFGSTYPFIGEFTVAMENGNQLPAGSTQFTGDEGSATLVVAKGINSAVSTSTLVPNGFYGENFTLQNTYDTDTATTTTTYSPSGTCVTNAGPALTYSALYNLGQLCASQALAIWTTSDLSLMNNVYLASLQDTIYAASQGSGSNGYVPARQYWFRGKVTGDVDYMFGDAAAVFDNTSIYTAWHGNSAGGTDTIEAQNKAVQTGSTGDYLSGYVMNGDVFTSQSTGMTNLYLGRPYGTYSTWIMLNSYLDQVNALGYTTGLGPTLTGASYGEFNDMAYTDPATGSPDLNGVPYLGTGGNTGVGVTGVREAASTNPGTDFAGNAVPTGMTQAQAQPYFPENFLGQTVPSTVSSTQNWDAIGAFAAKVNAFVPAGSSAAVQAGSSVTILMRPQTPGLGATAAGAYTIPTGTYTLQDTFGGSTTTLASGSLDASGEAYFTTSTLAAGSHRLTWSYSGDANFSASSTSSPYILNIAAAGSTAPNLTVTPASSATYGAAATVSVAVAQKTGNTVPTGSVLLSVDGGAATTGTLASGAYTFTVPAGLAAGSHTLQVTYNGDSNFSAVTVNSAMVVSRAVLNVAANSYAIASGGTAPTYAATITGFVNGDTQGTAITGAPSLTTNPATPTAVGIYPIVASTGTLASTNYTFSFTSGQLTIQSATQAAAVATGDTRTVTEPVIPATCQQLTASLTTVNDDLPASVDATASNPDGSRIQAALNACSGTGNAVRLSIDGAGHNAFLTGPLNMPSNVTLLVDPGVIVFFSRNVQDYQIPNATGTCGTVSSASATSSCYPLINIDNVTNVGIMGYGKLDGRGGDVLLNTSGSYAGQSWWGLSALANSGGSQQNPRFIQIGKGANVTLYKITLRNSPLFHVSTTGSGNNGLTAWDVKIVTPTSSRNTDGIDPGQAQNYTITRSWISDGDDNVAVGASGSPSANISVTDNHFFAGHGESIGSFTSGGVSNVLYDNNLLAGNSSVDSNSTGIRIKSANDRGGLVQNIQYSNSCFQNHKAELVFDPLYNTNTGTLTPNYKNILLQNLSFLTAGTVQMTGAVNGSTTNPLGITLDNVTFASLPSSDLTPAPSNVNMTYGPGWVSSNFVTDYAAFVGANGNTLTDNHTATATNPPGCAFTFIAPELTGPAGLPQTILSGQTATAVVILTPAVAGSAYPTGTVTLTDGASLNTTVTLPGTTDTIFIPLSNLSVGTHTLTATYSGDSNYVASSGPYSTMGPYLITVNAGSLASTTTALTGVPASTSYGTSFTATATVSGSSPTGIVSFVVNGSVYATAAVNSGVAQATFTLPVGSYTFAAIYSGDALNAGSTSSTANLTVVAGATTTTLTAQSATTTLGVPVKLTATVASTAGTPTGTVSFSYTTATNSTPTIAATATLTNGTVSVSVNLPIGADSVTATYNAGGSFAGSSSTPPLAITVNPPINIPLPATPIALPYTISTIAGGSTVANADTTCAGSVDKFGNGCLATATAFTGSVDLRSVTADPFGNVYLTDAGASMVRRIAPNGVISDFAGYVSGTACVPSATTGCTPNLVKLNKPRGVAADAQGNVYIAGYSDNKVYKYSVATGLLYLVAGNGARPSDPTQTNGDGGAATAAQLNGPRMVWPDPVGDIYIADTSDNKIREVDTNGNIQTIAGTGVASSTGDGGPASAATIDNPQGVLVDANSNVYIADSSRVRVICITCEPGSGLYLLLNKVGIAAPVNGDIYTLAGGGSTAYTAPILATNISGISPQKLAIDAASNLYISDGGGSIWFLDSRTAYIRRIAGGTSTACSSATDSIGDGCPATQAVIGDGGNGIGVGTDFQGNIYISDTLNGRIRKVSTNLQSPATADASTTTQTLDMHFIAGDAPAATNAFAQSSTEWTLGALNCTTNADTTVDCVLSSAFTPAVPGGRSTPFTVSSSLGNTAALALTGTGLGAGVTIDPASQISFGANLQPTGIAVDDAGNVYVADLTSSSLLKYSAGSIALGASAAPTTLAPLTGGSAGVAIDPRGYIYVSNHVSGAITQVSPAGAVSTLTARFANPRGIAADTLGNLFVTDAYNGGIDEVNLATGAQRTLIVARPLVSPTGLAIDASGNLVVADPAAAAVYRFNIATGALTAIPTPAAQPFFIATDAANNIFVTDTAAVDAVPASSNSAAYTVAAITQQPFDVGGLAIDSAGNLYTGQNGGITKFVRTQGKLAFATVSSPAQTVYLLGSGNQPLAITSITQTDSADYSLSASASADCTLTNGVVTGVAAGGACVASAAYTPTTYTPTTDVVTVNGNLSNAALSTPAAVQLALSSPASAPAPSIALGAFSPASPTYGQSVSVTATVTGATLTPAGSIAFSVDNGTPTSVTMAGGAATGTFSGLAAGPHTVKAVYTSTNGYTSVTTTGTVTVGKASAAVALVSNNNPSLAQSAVTFTATVTSAAGTPTGTVSFVDGTTTLGTGTLAAGVASYTTSTLAGGAHSITAVYSGDANFATFTSAPLTQNVGDFGLAIGTGGSTSLTLLPGATGTYTLSISPVGGATFLAPVTLSLSGLPSGATYAFSPATIAAGAGTTTVTLTVTVPKESANAAPLRIRANGGGVEVASVTKSASPAAHRTARSLAPFALAFLLLPFAGRMRKAGRRLGRALLALALVAAGFGAASGLSGCGGGSGFFTQPPQTYTLTVTGTSGSLSRSTTLTLTVE